MTTAAPLAPRPSVSGPIAPRPQQPAAAHATPVVPTASNQPAQPALFDLDFAATASHAPMRFHGLGQAAEGIAALHPAQVRTPDQVDQYYAAAQGKQGAQLTRALHDIISKGHRDLGYNGARDQLFTQVDDPDGDHVVTELYTGAQITGVDGRKSAYDHGINTEHTWPQSQGARGIAQADLHQLQPADIEINGKRGSYGYGEVKDIDWKTPVGPKGEFSVLGTDASGTTVFEPRAAVRGDIARGLLYFYTRYDDDRPADFTLDNFRHELPTLLKWNHDDPVDDAERARNSTIDAIQGNRNPYVDHPEWADSAVFDDASVRSQRELFA